MRSEDSGLAHDSRFNGGTRRVCGGGALRSGGLSDRQEHPERRSRRRKGNQTLMDFLYKLEQLPFSMWVLNSPSIWAYPTILTVHTIGMTIVAGLIGVIALRLLGMGSGTPIRPLERLYPF